MRERGAGSALVDDGGRLTGMITSHDFMRALASASAPEEAEVPTCYC
jgi:CBS domain-containing protein